MAEPQYPWYNSTKRPAAVRSKERRGSLSLGPEDCIQFDYFHWIDTHKHNFPLLELIFAVPNGSAKSRTQAAVMKATGLRPGVPDVCIPICMFVLGNPTPGMWIEFKKPGAYPTPEQKVWHERLRQAGHRVEICKSWIAAANLTISYMGLPLELIKE